MTSYDFERDNPEARRESVEFQWESLRQMFPDLPSIDRLAVMDENEVARTILRNVSMNRTRARSAITALMSTNELLQRYQANVVYSRDAEGSSFVSMANHEQAEAWVKTIFELVDAQDMQQMLEASPYIIQTNAGRHRWAANNVDINGIPRSITIDLTHPIWQSGDADTIQERLSDRRVVEAGITMNPPDPDYVLQDADRNNLFNSQAQVLDTALPQAITVPPTAVFRNRSLTDSINDRHAMSQMIAGASTRESMLALATLRRDPSAIRAIENHDQDEDDLRGHLAANEMHKRWAESAQALQGLAVNEHSEGDITAAEDIARTAIQNAANGLAANDGDPVVLYDASVLGANILSIVGAIPPSIIRQKSAAVPPGTRAAPTAQRDNQAEFRAASQKAHEILRNLQQERQRLRDLERCLRDLVSALVQQVVPIGSINPAQYPQVHAFLTNLATVPAPTTPAYEVQVNAIRRGDINLPSLVNEVRLLLRTEGTDRLALQEPAHYASRSTDLMRQIEQLRNNPPRDQNGSDACWAVIRRGLSHEMRLPENSPEIDSIIGVTRTISDRTNQTRSAIESITRRMIPAHRGIENAEAYRKWNNDPARYFPSGILGRVARIWDDELGSADVWPLYRDNLFNERHIGLRLDEDPMRRSIPLNRVVETYFKLDYLLNDTELGHLRLPQSRELYDFLRRLREAILARAQEGYYLRTGISEDVAQVLREQDNGQHPQGMTRIELVNEDVINRMRNNYLRDNSTAIKEMAESAYWPIQRRRERKDKSDQRWNRNVERGATGAAVAATGGYALLRGLFWPTRAVYGTVRDQVAGQPRHASSTTGGAALGAIAGGPVGAAVGGGIAAWLTRHLRRPVATTTNPPAGPAPRATP